MSILKRPWRFFWGIIFIFYILTTIFLLTYFLTPPFSYREKTFEFIVNNLWDSNNTSFMAYREKSGAIVEYGARKFASFNSWANLAFLEYSNKTNCHQILDEYIIPNINFIFNYLWNSTNGGVIHWCYQNGSLPPKTDLRYDDAVVQYATYQAWAIQVLSKVYKIRSNETYLEKIKTIANFLVTKLWDNTYGGFYIGYYPNRDAIDDTQKYLWYQTWPSIALYESYRVIQNETYKFYANQTLNFIIDHFWDNSYKGFYTQTFENGTIASTLKTVTDQASVLLALINYMDISGNFSLKDLYLLPTINFMVNELWNSEYQQFYSECIENGDNPNSVNSPADISFVILSLYDSNQFLNNNDTINKIISQSLEELVNNGWDIENGGFYRAYDIINKSILIEEKWIIEQVLPLYILSKISDIIVKDISLLIISGSLILIYTSIAVIVYLKLKGRNLKKESRNSI